ncbi:solute carrier family 52, riboflavin transporter, member 3-A [Neosynchiropus ocellatus]
MAPLVHALACAFGLGAWVAVNGLWVELPLMVNALPEGWELPSYLTVIIQLANVGPLLVTLAHRLRPGCLREAAVICSVLLLGVVSCALLIFFWDSTSVVGGAPHSTAFFVITFFLALVDCTSSVTFLPFMMQLPARYITSYFVGEGLSGFLPGVVALAQGVGVARCVNASHAAGNESSGEEWRLQTEYLPPNFSTEVFFVLLTVMMCISSAAFVMLNRQPRTYELSAQDLVPDAKPRDGGQKVEAVSDYSSYQLAVIYLLVMWVNGATNGVLPSVQTYSCLPYGTRAYHLSAALASVANPLAGTIATFLQSRSLLVLGLLAVAGSGCGGYNMAMAAMSPCPLLQGTPAGEAVIVLSWLLFTGLMSYVKVMVGVILRDRGHGALLWCGAAVQAGSLVGSITMFPLVNVFRLFESADMCSTQCPR